MPRVSRFACVLPETNLAYNWDMPETGSARQTREQRIEQFWSLVAKTDSCWYWLGSEGSHGYGQFSWRFTESGRKTMVLAHRFAYELVVGPIPKGLKLDHKHTCLKTCVNPDHLRVVTNKQNAENLSGAHIDSISGIRGVSPAGWRWRAQVGCEDRSWSKVFDTIDEAEAAVIAKRLELFTHNDADRLC